MDMKIAGSGVIAAGEYENIRVSGSAKVGGPMRCQSFHCSGSAHCTGGIDAHKDIKVSGSAHFDQSISAQDIGISGSARIDGNCTGTGEIRISGAMRCDGDIKGNGITDPTDVVYVFYTYNHYNDFREYLNYYGGWGEMFGNITGGGTISSKTDCNPTPYVPVAEGSLSTNAVEADCVTYAWIDRRAFEILTAKKPTNLVRRFSFYA